MPKSKPRRRNGKRVRGDITSIQQSIERIAPQQARRRHIMPKQPAPPYVPRPRPIRQPGR